MVLVMLPSYLHLLNKHCQLKHNKTDTAVNKQILPTISIHLQQLLVGENLMTYQINLDNRDLIQEVLDSLDWQTFAPHHEVEDLY